MDARARSPLRYLAPIALIAAVLVSAVVLVGSQGGDPEPAATQSANQAGGSRGGGDGGKRKAGTYEVQDGDTLEAISQETGVSVERILELNPELDPQSLIAGEELRLSE